MTKITKLFILQHKIIDKYRFITGGGYCFITENCYLS
jgi:hypothetical protein